MNILFATLKVLKFPIKLLARLVRKRPKRTEREQKQWKHVRNFAPRHYSWQKSLGKDKKSKKKRKQKKREIIYRKP